MLYSDYLVGRYINYYNNNEVTEIKVNLQNFNVTSFIFISC